MRAGAVLRDVGRKNHSARRFFECLALVSRLPCVPVGMSCAPFTPDFAALSRRFALGSRLSLRLCRGALPSVHACLFSFVRKKETDCDILRSYSAGSRSPFVRSRGVGAVIGLGWNAELVCEAMRFLSPRLSFGLRLTLRLCRGALPSVHACLCGSVAALCPRFTPVFFPLSGKKRRLAGCCVSIPPGRDRHSCVLAALVWLSALVGSLRVWMFLYGDPDEGRGNGGWGYGAGGAAFVRLCAATLAL